MSNVHHAKWRESGRMLAAAGLLAALLVGCRGSGSVEVSAAGLPPVSNGELGSTFQGSIASVDLATGEFVVAVQIVWTPVLKADRHERRVVVDAGPRWVPAEASVSQLRVGDNVQTKALATADDRWRALEVIVVDVD